MRCSFCYTLVKAFSISNGINVGDYLTEQIDLHWNYFKSLSPSLDSCAEYFSLWYQFVSVKIRAERL